ncbi:multiple sugar transport system ATP-binding protein [Alteribacillus persepolensis]|uniref:Multiple sugar transport system ATP-binding protein n=1 Tax=Alteribacillus persepolensis TaxID=568899 RepID=A0A1G8GKA4_9BACI|nr:ABC transporter ATP-binding protein [Alteribacillus persepolensis]SDH94824.1 multiple sugar transport system ATP-binding protein [Alteribacillus persepolensis]
MQVRYENINKKFGNVHVLKNLHLTVNDGEFLVLLGPSGCGKSTALRMLAGLENPTSGEIYIGGQPVTDMDPKDRDISMVFQSYALYPHMSVFENITYPLKIRKVPKAERKKKADDIAEILEIGDLLKRKPKELSGGQRQRVALGRSLIRQPNVFLMDEPLSNLDAKLRVHMRGEIKRLHSELGITSVYVTHDQTEAMTMADRIAIMEGGHLQQLASPDEIYHQPANRYVGGFIGSPAMNSVKGRLNVKTASLDFGTFTIPIDQEWQEILEKRLSGQDIYLGIRPENVRVATKPAENSIKGEVYVVEPLGKEVITIIRAGGHTIVAIVEPDLPLKMNQKVWLTFDEQKLHMFDGKTEEKVV